MSQDDIAGADTGFGAFKLNTALQQTLEDLNYTEPSPIQARTIPLLMEGRDVLGLAQTGTGKTAAFALPILQGWQREISQPQALVLAPTRELAMQVAEAFKSYAKNIRGFKAAAIYGGQDMRAQLRTLRQGVHVVVATPGRLMDHLRRGSVDFSAVNTVVLDEADEMLRMGFQEDVQWILEHLPEERQTALFSATMPPGVRRIAEEYLNNPERVEIASKQRTAEHIEQHFCMIPRGWNKFQALQRTLEVSNVDAAIIFVRTRGATTELSQQLEQKGYRAAAINGDMNQAQRERSIDALKQGRLDLLVATDVAARGIDVARISHVINFDPPHDQESYIHRIGRTGRAGRSGQAIMFITPRERGALRSIERVTRTPMKPMDLPTNKDLAKHRRDNLIQQVADDLGQIEDVDFYRQVVKEICQRHQMSPEEAAAALIYRVQAQKPLQLPKDEMPAARTRRDRFEGDHRFSDRRERGERGDRGRKRERGGNRRRSDMDLVAYRAEVGSEHEVRPGDLVGAIANETGIHPDYIGSIQIRARHTIIEMPADIPKDVFEKLGKVWVRNKPLKIQRDSGEIANFQARPRRFRDRNENGGGTRDERSFSERRRSGPNKGGDKRHASKGPRGKKPGFDADAPLRKAAGADF